VRAAAACIAVRRSDTADLLEHFETLSTAAYYLALT
jgi:hypothetical protein